MPDVPPAQLYRFGVFEADATTGELRRQGIRVKLNAQPFQVLSMLLERSGELLTREEISRELWSDGTFIDAEHGVNSAVNRIREALGDRARNPRFVETLARRGYRFIAPVERVPVSPEPPKPVAPDTPEVAPEVTADQPYPISRARWRLLASEDELPATPYAVVRTLFVLLQLMYVGFYVGALANLREIADLLSVVPFATEVLRITIATAALLIPVRAFVISAVLFRPPGARRKLLKIWPFLLVTDELWAMSPFLLLHHINFGLALSCTALLVYSPFAQRSLVLMGAAGAERASLAATD